MIPPFIELAKSYGANVSDTKGLLSISVPCRRPAGTDVSFSYNSKSFLARLLGRPARVEIAKGVFVHGTSAGSVVALMEQDSELCEALGILLSRFRVRIDWSNDAVSVRIGAGVPAADATGGKRFLSNLVLVARRLERIGEDVRT